MATASIVTIGNELVSGDIENTNGSWLAARLEALGVDVVLVAALPDDEERVAAFVRAQAEVARRLRERFHGNPDYAARWAQLPRGSRALEIPRGGAPGFVIGNVYVLPGLPAEMEAMFETLSEELRSGSPIDSWRRTYRTTESRIVAVLEAAGEQYPGVRVGSYPSFGADGGTVEIVLKSSDPDALAAATAWLEQALADTIG